MTISIWRRVVWAFIFMAALTSVSCFIRPMRDYERAPTLPEVDGYLSVPGLHGEVGVFRDKWGVPHIFTNDKHDLFFATGYVQAQDRLWEIYLFRAIATGRLCEMFGNAGVPGADVMGMGLSTLSMDKRMRIMGMRQIGESGAALLAETQPEILATMQSFCDGVNAFIEQNRDRAPIEFQVLYFEPDPLTPADMISLSRFYGSMLCGNLDDELARYALIDGLGEEMAWKLMPLHDSLGPTVVPTNMLHPRLPRPRPLEPDQARRPIKGFSGDAAMRLALFEKAFRTAAMFPKDTASNNWVAGPKVTETKTAFLANDPHLVHIQPSLCYVMHLRGAGYDAYGVVFPGQPYIVMGHGRHMSWGATVTGADVQDLFIETVDKDRPGKYLYKGEWRDFVEREEVIRIRPGKVQWGPDRRYREVKVKVRHSIHGPIINDMVPGLGKDTPPLAFRWVGWDFSRDPKLFEVYIESSSTDEFIDKIRRIGTRNLKVINVGMMFETWMKGKGVDDFIKGMHYNVLLNMNWVCADSSGHIAYLPGGLVPVRKRGIGVMPVPGESGEYDWIGFIPLMEHPHAIDPARGWMATANNQVVEAEYYPYVFATNYSSSWRAWRIEELIEELKPLDMADMKRIQNDVYVKKADVFVPMILDAVEAKVTPNDRVALAAKVLSEWDRYATIDSAGAAIFYDTMSHLTDNVVKDDFKKKDYNDLVKGHVGHTVEMMFINGDDEFMDDKRTRGKVEDADDMLVKSLADAVKWLSKTLGKDVENWRWGDLHTIKWYHPMGFGPLKEMSVGPFPHPGGDSTVRNAGSMGFGKRKYMCMGGPVMRHVIDMGDVDNAQLVIDGSQSGQWLSPHYRDLHSLWYNSEYMTAEKRPTKVIEEAESTLILTP